MINETTYPLITIAIPTYNRANLYLRQAIECAVNQTYSNIEIIISDNCSTDNTEMVVKDFTDPRIRYFRHEKNIGGNNNFNFCLEQAKGEYFLLLMDDDLIDRDFIETCWKSIDCNGNVGIIRTGTRIIDFQGKIIHEYPNMVGGFSLDEFFRGWFANKTTLYICSTLFNTIRLKEVGGFQSKKNLFQDVIAEAKLAARFGRLDIQDIKASARKHASELTFAHKVSDWCEDSLDLLDLICELVSKERKTLIRNEGMVFFSGINYSRARAVKSPTSRFIAHFTVFKKFNYRHPPSIKHFFYPMHKYLYGTPLYYLLRSIKRKIKRKAGEAKHQTDKEVSPGRVD
ncbi:putative beta-1,4-galactosyltransferase [Candidatus Kuenenia stuttgartiensis]|uniref:Putative beta-1,4-galactosyltransferase n=2 Tax=Kuenenia stuttgartiensis TaxID=174633 RepID=Q1Q704_KUEST|nr:glycosyltransferase [Candidatus Kuenenia stuttgartiensis]QII12840.1 putative beta-1,4-galactosyltransferase [Candidatus Kuenenia stuttgartiensis]CAJ73355.1 similar to beta-1,4-galactosyltransferase [Candidatus Kuenenia stuttgartiensis]